MWLEQKFDLLIQEAEKCDKKLPRSCSNITDEQAIKIFSRLMLEGKIREATRFITEREESGGIMSPGDDAGKPKGRTVMEVLLSKIQSKQILMRKLLLNARNCLSSFMLKLLAHMCKELPIN